MKLYNIVILFASVPISLQVTDFIKEIISTGTWVTQFLQIKVNSSIVIYKFNRNIMALIEITKITKVKNRGNNGYSEITVSEIHKITETIKID